MGGMHGITPKKIVSDTRNTTSKEAKEMGIVLRSLEKQQKQPKSNKTRIVMKTKRFDDIQKRMKSNIWKQQI